jgi:hypothetical protein
MSRVLYYKCKKCSSSIEPNTRKKLVFCKCGKIGVDGTNVNSRIVGDKDFVIHVCEEEDEIAYRIKHVKSGLYYKPYSYPSSAKFTKTGKLYSRKPCLNWVTSITSPAECVIERYKLSTI